MQTSPPRNSPVQGWILLLVCVILLLYLRLTCTLRWRRYINIHSKYAKKFQQGTLSVQEAQEIMHVSALWDMPDIFKYSLSFATVKTYAMPSISKILLATKQISTKENVSRRYADTGILTYTVVTCPVSGVSLLDDVGFRKDPRGVIAIARMNWLHDKYPIRNDDFLYTLSLYILENISWADTYGWRKLSPMEQHAIFLFWSEVGTRMGIEGIPGTIETLRSWSKDHEKHSRRQGESNRLLVNFAYDTGAAAYPSAFGLRRAYRGLLSGLLDDACRKATMQPVEPWYIHALTACILHGLKYFHRYLAFPRTSPSSDVQIEMPEILTPDSEIRMHPNSVEFCPWYKTESKGWGLNRLMDNILFMFGARDALPGPKLKSEGYRLEEVGPLKWEHSGHEEVMLMAESMNGCPIEAPWNLSEKLA